MVDIEYIDGTKHVMGRLASYIAKAALEGKKIIVLNSEKVVITGKKSVLIANYKLKTEDIGSRTRGPYPPKRPDDILRQSIKRMLPYKKPRGAEAFKRIKTYIGVPKELADAKTIQIENAKLHDAEVKFITLGDLSKQIGGFNG